MKDHKLGKYTKIRLKYTNLALEPSISIDYANYILNKTLPRSTHNSELGFKALRTVARTPKYTWYLIRHFTFVESHFKSRFWAEFSLFSSEEVIYQSCFLKSKNLKKFWSDLRSRFYIFGLINRFLFPLHFTYIEIIFGFTY